jgi:glutamine synthetase
MFADGVMFDGSSIAGWKAINESDMTLMPDTATAHMDPFFAQSTMAIFCDILDPITGEALQPRSAFDGQEGRSLSQASGLGDTVYIGPEAEFFIFDDVKFKADPYNTGFKLDSSNCRPTWAPNTKPATGPPSAHQGRLLPGPAGRQLPGHAFRNAHRDAEMGA